MSRHLSLGAITEYIHSCGDVGNNFQEGACAQYSFSLPDLQQQRRQCHSSATTEKSSDMTKLKKVTETHYIVKAKAEAGGGDWAPMDEELPLDGDGSLRSRNSDPILDNRDDDSEVNAGSLCGVIRDDDTASRVTGTDRSSSRRFAHVKQATDSDQIAAWRREMSFCISNPGAVPLCGDYTSSIVSRLDPIDEKTELQQGPMQRLASIGQYFCNPCSKTDEGNNGHSTVDGIVAFRQCYSYRIEPADSNKERYALVDADQEEANADEDSIAASTADTCKDEPFLLPVDDHTVPSIGGEGDASAIGPSQMMATEATSSLLDTWNWCADGLCGLFLLRRRQNNSTNSSAVSISDMTMPEDGGIFVVRNGATREVELGEDVAAVDDQLGEETCDRNYPGKLIEEKAKVAGDEMMQKAEEAKISLNGLAAVLKTMASSLTQNAEDREILEERGELETRPNEDDLRRTSGARLHADMVRDALEEAEARNESEEDKDAQSVGGDFFITTRASF